MPDNRRRTRREVQAQLRKNKNSQQEYEQKFERETYDDYEKHYTANPRTVSENSQTATSFEEDSNSNIDNRKKKSKKSKQKKSKQSKRNNANYNVNNTSSSNNSSYDNESTSSSKKKKKKSGTKSIFANLFLIEAILIVILYRFIGLAIIAVIALIPVLYFFRVKRNKKRGLKRPKGSLIVFIIYLLLIIFGVRTNGVLSSLVSNSQTNEFYVMAASDDEVGSVEEIADGTTIGLGAEDSYNTNVFAKSKFEEEGFSFNYSVYDKETEAAEYLLNGNERFIVVSNPKAKELKAIDGFTDSTKVIGHYKETVEIQSSGKNINRQTFTILLTGVDSRTDSIDSNSRSDSIMVAKVNPNTGESAIISLPRDAYVLSSCTGSYDKITHSSLNGMNCLIDDVETLLDVEIDYYLTVNFYAVIDAIDAVGGIDVEVESSFCGQDENDNLNAYCFDQGNQHLNGAEALSYARERHAFSDGDYARARHQQQVISSFLKALATSGPFAINNLLDVASNSARTNLSASQLTSLAKLLQKSKDFTIDSYTVQGYGLSADIPYWGLYGTSVQQLDDASITEAQGKLNAIK